MLLAALKQTELRRGNDSVDKPGKTILFVCVGNAGRSQMAEAFFNHLASGQAHALSAGTQPADRVGPMVVEAMREVGIDIADRRPKPITQEMLETADRVITMGCSLEEACPAPLVDAEDWALDDPKGQPLPVVRGIRDEIRKRVEDLLRSLDS